jgi:hypothetical protein
MAEGDRRLDVELRIERGRNSIIRVVTRAGVPLRETSLIHAVDGVMQRTVVTNELGEALVPLPERAQSVIYAVPREGSLAVARVRPNVETHTIVIPDAVASIELRTEDGEGEPIPNVRFLMRMDGEVIPPDIHRHVERLRGDPVVTDATGSMTMHHLPVAFFEFWPLRAYGEMQDVYASISESAPVQVPAKPGRNTATLRFERRP